MSPVTPRRRSSGSIVASPVLVGAVTTLVVVVAVFLAYGANNGLPFVPTRELKVEFPTGNELVKGNEVREGGYRIGVVELMLPVRQSDGRVVAQAMLKLDKKAGAFPVDTVATVRPRSALGLEYVDLTKGTSPRIIADGGFLPVGQVRSEVELDQVFNLFDQTTRVAIRGNLQEFGNGFVGRGGDLNSTISQLPRTFGLLVPVARNLASPQTNLRNFFIQLDRTARTVAPVSQTFAHLFSTMATTFAAIDRDPAALKQTISDNPSTLDVGTRSLAAQRPFLNDTAALGPDLSAAAVALRGALPALNQALVVGTRVTRRTPVLYSRLQGAMDSLKSFALAPTTNAALRGLTATVGTLQPTLRYVGPYVTVCNDWNTLWTFLAESMSAPAPGGTALRNLINNGGPGDPLESMGAATPANGQAPPAATGNPPVFFHAQPYPAAVTSSGQADCEAGQRGYIKRSPHAPPGYNIAGDPHNEVGYRAGPTYQNYSNNGPTGLGPDKLPPGETFTREPGGIGAQIDPNLQGSP